jgi:hypothetical protein
LEYFVKNNRKEGCPTLKKEKERKEKHSLQLFIKMGFIHNSLIRWCWCYDWWILFPRGQLIGLMLIV